MRKFADRVRRALARAMARAAHFAVRAAVRVHPSPPICVVIVCADAPKEVVSAAAEAAYGSLAHAAEKQEDRTT